MHSLSGVRPMAVDAILLVPTGLKKSSLARFHGPPPKDRPLEKGIVVAEAAKAFGIRFFPARSPKRLARSAVE